MMQSVFEQSLL